MSSAHASAFLHCSRQALATQNPQEPLSPEPRSACSHRCHQNASGGPAAESHCLFVFHERPPNKPQWNLSCSFCSRAPPRGHIGSPSSTPGVPDSGVPTMPSSDRQVVGHGGLPDICTPISNPHTVGLFHSVIQRMDLFWHLLTSASETEHTHLPGLQTQKYSQAEATVHTCTGGPGCPRPPLSQHF